MFVEFFDPINKFIYTLYQGDTLINKISFSEKVKRHKKRNYEVKNGIRTSGFLDLNYPSGFLLNFGYRYGISIEVNSGKAVFALSRGNGYEFMCYLEDYIGFNYTFINIDKNC